MTSNSLDFNLLNQKLVKLARILHIENKLLTEFKIEKTQSMQAEKNEIISYIINSKEKFMKDIDKHKKTKYIESIKNSLISIENDVQKNIKLTIKAMNANKKIIEIFATQLKEQNKICYDNKGSKMKVNFPNSFSSLNLYKV